MIRTCRLFSDPCTGELPALAAQYAQLFGLECDRVGSFTRSERHVALLAMSYRTLRSLGKDQIARAREMVRAGSVLYVRGGFGDRETCSLAPFTKATIRFHRNRSARAYRIEPHRAVPEVLGMEAAPLDGFSSVFARDLPSIATVMACSQGDDSSWGPFLFAMPLGWGMAIFDLLEDSPMGEPPLPISRRIADPSSRYAEIGALAAVRLAAGISPQSRPGIDLVLDDRPANFDYLNCNRVGRWLKRADNLFSGVHVDFAWTPNQFLPARKYIETLKQFNTGFVWHGFKRHIRHLDPKYLARELCEGRALVSRIEERFNVKFQPVMVFPFEVFSTDVLLMLEAGGFKASFASSAVADLRSPLPAFVEGSTSLHEQFVGHFPVLRRHSLKDLTRDVLLSQAALHLPLIVIVHPHDLGLRRWPYFPLSHGDPAQCDRILSFAAEKRLRPQSLDEIVDDALSKMQPRMMEPTQPYRVNA